MTDDLFDSALRGKVERLRERLALVENQFADLTARLPSMAREIREIGAEMDRLTSTNNQQNGESHAEG